MKPFFPKYLIAFFLLTLFLRIVLIPYYDYNLGGIEPNVIYGIQRILQGQPLYQDPSAGTYAIMQYSPVYYHFIAALARLTSTDACQHGLDVHRLYVLCRIAALFFNLLTVFVCALIIRTWRFSWFHSMVYALPALICLTVHYYTRGDSMHLFFFVTAIYLYILHSRRRSLAAIFFAAVSTAACILTKQSGVLCAGIIACCLVFVERRYFMALIYLLFTSLLAYAIAVLFIHGNWLALYQNTVLGLKNGIDFSFLYAMFTSQYFLDMVACYLLGGTIIYLAYSRSADKTFRYIAMGVLLSWLFAAITGLKIGSGNNYFTEFLVFIIAAVPYLLQNDEGNKILFRFKKQEISIRRFALAALFILVTSKTVGLFTAVYIDHSFKNDKAEYAKEQVLYNYFHDVLHLKKGEYIFFTENRFLNTTFMPYSMMPTKDVITQVYTTDSTTFNYSGFAAKMNSGLIKYIVTDEKRNDINVCSDSLPFIFFDKNHFTLLASVSGYCVYCFVPTVAMKD